MRDEYVRVVTLFLAFCSVLQFVLSSPQAIDLAMSAFFDELYFDGLGFSTGEKLIAAWCFCFPEFRSVEFLFAARSVRGWKRLKPPEGRHPLPWVVCCALAALMASEAGPLAGVAMLLLFDAYLRPYELFGIRLKDLLAPALGFDHWTVVICPYESKRPSKTKVFDDSVRLDSKFRPAVGHVVSRVAVCHPGLPTDIVFPYTHKSLNALMAAAVEKLSLKSWGFTLYAARHGGPSQDRADVSRNLGEIQRRGRWASDSALRRYEQVGRLHVVLANIAPDIIKFCSSCSNNIEELIMQPRPLYPPSVVPLKVPAARAE